MTQKEEIRNWYNTFSANQKITGVNLRHYTIVNKLLSLGLKSNSKVLEIGCGIGTLTGLLSNKVKKGKLVATDISDESIRIAGQRLNNPKHVELFVTDMADFSVDEKFDFVVLPDVMEHIPVEQHADLFMTIRKHLHQDSIVFIHIPHPKAIEYVRENDPDKLQVIDQALSANRLISDAYKHNFLLMEYKAYKLFSNSFDYVFITFGIDKPLEHIKPIRQNSIILNKLIERMKYYLS
jgi:trans-aconitate 2-methyltransferase